MYAHILAMYLQIALTASNCLVASPPNEPKPAMKKKKKN